MLNLSRVTKAIIAYVPVVHRKLIEVVGEESCPVLVLGKNYIDEFPQLKHDLRAVWPHEAVAMLRGLGFVAGILTPTQLSNLLSHPEICLVLPRDEVMMKFAELHLSGMAVKFCNFFVRWDKINTTSENAVGADRAVTCAEFSCGVIKGCREKALLSSDWWRQVGAAVVKDGKVLLWGTNRHLPTDYSPYIDGDIRQCFSFGERLEICGAIHAEGAVIGEAARLGVSLEGCDFYVTTFPCPTCARLITQAGVRRVFYDQGYSVSDAHDILRNKGIEIVKVEMGG